MGLFFYGRDGAGQPGSGWFDRGRRWREGINGLRELLRVAAGLQVQIPLPEASKTPSYQEGVAEVIAG
ncbi:hypothetical protein VAWG004_00870 [Aeromonas veronii]|nr:hypothetical protein VAWG004_00870 [Aeromonas veronii]